MTNSDHQPAPPTATVSINDSLPTTNPSLRTVLIVLGCLGAAARPNLIRIGSDGAQQA